MSYTLGELLFEVLSALGQVTTFKASGGSTSTAVNTNTGYVQTNLTGTLLVRETTDGLAPQNEFSEVTGFTTSSGTFTFSPVVTAAIGSGDTFGYASPLYPLYQVIENINDGLRMLGDLPLVDTSTLTTAASQTEYTASVAWKRKPPYRVDIQTNIDSDDNKWEEIKWWEYVPATAGSTGLIVFQRQLATGYALRVWYQDKHPRVSSYDDVIAEAIDPEFAVVACTLKAAEWQNRRTQGSEPGIVDTYKKALENYNEMKREYVIQKPKMIAKSRLAELWSKQ